MVITLAYLAVLALGAMCVAARHGPILLPGRSVLWLNGIALLVHVLFRPSPALLWVSLFALIFGVSWVGVDNWFVVKAGLVALASAYETRSCRVLIDFRRGP